jgi:glutamine synthetase
MDGEPFAAAPRVIFKQVLKQCEAQGYSYKTGVEAEFFLLKQNDTGYQIADKLDTAVRPCYDQLNLMRQFDFISTVVGYLEQLGWEPYQCDHEDANVSLKSTGLTMMPSSRAIATYSSNTWSKP